MTRYVLALIAAVGSSSGEATAAERNYTIRGNGYIDGGGRSGRMELSEARMTLRDNGYFAVTLFTRGERFLVRGNWNRRNGNVERITIEDAWGQRAEGTGTIQYRRDGDAAPERMVIEGRTRNGTFHVVIDEDRRRGGNSGDVGGWDRGDWDRDVGVLPGNRGRLRSNVDARSYGDGILRMSGVRGGDFSTARTRLGTNGDVRIDIEHPTTGSIRGEIEDVRGDRVTVRVTSVLGHSGSGELVVVLRGTDEVSRINGSGTSRNGSWQLDFDGNGRRADDRWDDSWERSERGSGQLRQDVGPSLAFDRMRVSLQRDHQAIIVLDGRRDPVRLSGRWSAGRSGDVIIDLQYVNEMRASGRLALRRSGGIATSLNGSGRTERGRFEVFFTR